MTYNVKYCIIQHVLRIKSVQMDVMYEIHINLVFNCIKQKLWKDIFKNINNVEGYSQCKRVNLVNGTSQASLY